MKRFLVLVAIALLVPSMVNAGPMENLQAISDGAQKITKHSDDIVKMSYERYPFKENDHGVNDKVASVVTVTMNSLGYNLSFASRTLQEVVFLYMAFSEDPKSDQGQQILQLLHLEKQALEQTRQQIKAFEEIVELMHGAEAMVCREGIALLDASIEEVNSLFNG